MISSHADAFETVSLDRDVHVSWMLEIPSCFAAGGFRWGRRGCFGFDEAEGGQEEFAVGNG